MFVNAFKKHRIWKVASATVLAGSLAAGMSLVGFSNNNEVEAASRKSAKTAKNVIVMISDGCGYNHITATDYYDGEKQEYEKFPVRLGMSTYESENVGSVSLGLLGYDPVLAWSEFTYVRTYATDSASAATAMAGGTKTYNGAIGVDLNGDDLYLISERAEDLGKSTGVITTVEWSHATPAGFVAHNTSRNNYEQIAQEMINESTTDVIMGAGNPDYDDNGDPASKSAKYVGGASLWNVLKTGGYAPNDANGDGVNDAWTLIQTKEQFEALATAESTPARVCGTPQVYTTLQQARSGDGNAAPHAVALNDNVPDLATMAQGALNVLDNNEDGFFLMIEGGAIDWASHANQTGRMIEEEMDFNEAVEAVIDWVKKNSNWGETLLIVTADHECGYLCGPGSGTTDGVATFAPIVNNGKGNVPGVAWCSGEHTNSLIPIYAKGDAAQSLKTYVRTSDPVRGAYVDNTNIADLVFGVMK